MVHQLSPPMWTVSQPHKHTNTHTKQHNPTLHIAHLLKPGILFKIVGQLFSHNLIVCQRSWSCLLVPLYSTLAPTSSSDIPLQVMSCFKWDTNPLPNMPLHADTMLTEQTTIPFSKLSMHTTCNTKIPVYNQSSSKKSCHTFCQFELTVKCTHHK